MDIKHCKSLTAVADDTFEAILPSCVLEHLWEPWRSMEEIFRVWKPVGLVCGEVALVEPYRQSYLHFTHWQRSISCESQVFETFMSIRA